MKNSLLIISYYLIYIQYDIYIILSELYLFLLVYHDNIIFYKLDLISIIFIIIIKNSLFYYSILISIIIFHLFIYVLNNLSSIIHLDNMNSAMLSHYTMTLYNYNHSILLIYCHLSLYIHIITM
jgi:hypothetical protein